YEFAHSDEINERQRLDRINALYKRYVQMPKYTEVLAKEQELCLTTEIDTILWELDYKTLKEALFHLRKSNPKLIPDIRTPLQRECKSLIPTSLFPYIRKSIERILPHKKQKCLTESTSTIPYETIKN